MQRQLDYMTDLEIFIGLLMHKLGVPMELSANLVNALIGKVEAQKILLDYLEEKFHTTGMVTEREIINKVGELL